MPIIWKSGNWKPEIGTAYKYMCKYKKYVNKIKSDVIPGLVGDMYHTYC